MEHCYVFDYSTDNIYHIKLSDDITKSNEEVENYLSNNLGFKLSTIEYMITENELDIIEL